MAITYSISGGADATKFNINATTGVVSFKTAPDFENPSDANADNVYEVTVKATDPGGAATTQALRVTVTDVAENTNLPPQFTSAGAVNVAENTTSVITVVAVDPDDGGTTPPPSGQYDIPLSWNDPMFTGMSTGGGGQMANGDVKQHLSVTGADSCIFVFNQSGTAKVSYCRITSTVSCDADCLLQVSGNQSYIDHTFMDNNIATNPTGTHVDGIQLQRLIGNATGGLLDVKNTMIIVGGTSVTAGLFCADNWSGRINLTDVVIQTWSQHGLRVHADNAGDVDLYLNNVFFDTRGGVNGMLLNYGGHVVNVRQWNNVRKCTVNNGVLTPGAAIPQPVPSSGGTIF